MVLEAHEEVAHLDLELSTWLMSAFLAVGMFPEPTVCKLWPFVCILPCTIPGPTEPWKYFLVLRKVRCPLASLWPTYNYVTHGGWVTVCQHALSCISSLLIEVGLPLLHSKGHHQQSEKATY